ncbi:MAG: type II secretion system protein [Holophagaceae bacterium]
MSQTSRTARITRSSGYTMLELMLVMGIIGVLSMVGVTQVRTQNSGAVRGLLDEVEGALANAHQAAAATGRDVAIVTWGTWDVATPMVMAHGEATLDDPAIKTAATTLLGGGAPSATVAVPFRFQAGDRGQSSARIVSLASDQWSNVIQECSTGTNVNINDVAPFTGSGGIMHGLTTDSNLLFTGADHRVLVSGSSRRFASTFIIPIVGTTTSGSALPGGPMGLIVVLQNGAAIYKFYNPGSRDGDGQWRRI